MPEQIIIYESSSFGGCYDYSIELHKAYSRHKKVDSCRLILPKNAHYEGDGCMKLLAHDQPKRLKSFHFLWRQLFNPIRLFLNVRTSGSSTIIFNDFEQISAFLWVWLYMYFANQHKYIIVLHDPDRDDYPPSRSISSWCMTRLLSMMDYGLYHEQLPQKKYYVNSRTRYLNVPHGIYQLPESDRYLLNKLNTRTEGKPLILILGAIRSEKNPKMAIDLVTEFPDTHLLIAGKPSNQSNIIRELKRQIEKAELRDRVKIIDRFLTYEEMSACINASDIIWLNYSHMFKSQSGIFSSIASFKKKLLICDGDNAMASIARRFNVGQLVEPDNAKEAKNKLKHLLSAKDHDWSEYLTYASWEKHVDLVLNTISSDK